MGIRNTHDLPICLMYGKNPVTLIALMESSFFLIKKETLNEKHPLTFVDQL